jgi:hypothetical protein
MRSVNDVAMMCHRLQDTAVDDRVADADAEER